MGTTSPIELKFMYSKAKELFLSALVSNLLLSDLSAFEPHKLLLGATSARTTTSATAAARGATNSNATILSQLEGVGRGVCSIRINANNDPLEQALAKSITEVHVT